METLSDWRQGAGSSQAMPQVPDSNAESRPCARTSVTPPSSAALAPVTQRARTAGTALARVTERAAVQLDRPGSLVHAQPPSLSRAREMHHEAARHHDLIALRHLRLLWGYGHVVFVKATLNFLEWVTETPARFFLAVIIGVIVWYFGVKP